VVIITPSPTSADLSLSTEETSANNLQEETSNNFTKQINDIQQNTNNSIEERISSDDNAQKLAGSSVSSKKQ
jgi:hypothetical protein